jgi:hypothetical protein
MATNDEIKKNCEHKDVRYEPSINEGGWICMNCHSELGFRPDLDRSQTQWKALAILNVLHDGGIVHVSNGSEGDGIIWSMQRNCEKADRYDQTFIAITILRMMDVGEGKYWREEAKKKLASAYGVV